MTSGRTGGGSEPPMVVEGDGKQVETCLVESPLRMREEPNVPETENTEGFSMTPVPNASSRRNYTGKVKGSIPITSYETPTRTQLRNPSKLVFFSDRKSVPTELKSLQERTMKRRRDFLSRIHDLNAQTAKVLSQCAEERMNLNLATSDTFERTVVHPLVLSFDRLSIQREGSTNRSLDIPALERRVGNLDAQMTRHIHVTMTDATVGKLESLEDDLQRNLKSEIRVENTTFNKIEGGIVQQFESAAGVNNRNVHAEGAAHRSAVALLHRRIDKSMLPKRFERAGETLSRIRSLREELRKERAVREATDKAIYEEIVRRTGSLKRAMISMASDDDNWT